MTYQVLARKWRPQTFSDLVGQSHVKKALTFALTHHQVHHAYLLTGTRGVGKTSIARIFAKSLNCETNGVSASPCGECESCREIRDGKFVDLIEVDAASRTGVDETRELIDSVAYLPAKGRYKVYLIDEVHMFSKSSFNALLKTLEEPPEHVKFILATTDPEKLPITILSRCLQFNLKSLTQAQIKQHLVNICQAESIDFDSEALSLLANAGDGSMRDTLSMTDQAIAYGEGYLNMQAVTEILGTIQPADIEAILFAIATNNPMQLSEALHRLDDYEVDAKAFLIEIMRRLQRMAWVKEGIAEPISETLKSTINDIPKALLHLWYDIAEKALPNLGLSGDPRAAVEMTLLRMLAFVPNDWLPRQRTPLSDSPRIDYANKTQENTLSAEQSVQSVSEATVGVQTVENTPPWEMAESKTKAVNKQPAMPEQPVAIEKTQAYPIDAQDSLEAAEQVFSEQSRADDKVVHITEDLATTSNTVAMDQVIVDDAETSWHLSSEATHEPPPSIDEVKAMMQRGSDIAMPKKTVAEIPAEPVSLVSDSQTETAVVVDERNDIYNISSLLPETNEQQVEENENNEQALTEKTAETPLSDRDEIELYTEITGDEQHEIPSPTQQESVVSSFDWWSVFQQLSLSNYSRHFASLGILRLRDGADQLHAVFNLSPNNEVLINDEVTVELQAALQQYFSRPVLFSIELAEINEPTPLEIKDKQEAQQQSDLLTQFKQQPVVQQIVNELGGEVIEKTVKAKQS